jgi:hypothetical protein
MAGILKVDRIQEANSGQGVELSHKLVDTSGNTIISENNGVATFGSSVAPSTNYTFRNKIINGNLKSARVINQRGATSITGATGYTYDRWYYDGSTYLYQGIEDLNVNNGTYCVSWVGSDITAQYLLSTDTTANNGWDGVGTFQTVANGGTFTVNESPEHGKHLWIRFSGTLSNLDKVMVEEGTVPTPFEHRPISVELSLCQRYFTKSHNSELVAGTSATGGGAINVFVPSNGTGYFGVYVPFPVEMRNDPTITLFDSANASGKVFKGGDGKSQHIFRKGRRGFSGGTQDATNTNELFFTYTALDEL